MAVTVYTRGDCPFCDALKRRLERDGTSYTEIDVATQPRAMPELMKLTGGERIVPVIIDRVGVRIAPEGGTRF